MQYKEYAVRFLSTSNARKERHLVASDENNADTASLRKASDASTGEKPASPQMGENTHKLMCMIKWPLEELIRQVKSDPNIIHSVDIHGATLMHVAAKKGRTDILEYLIDDGAIIDVKDVNDNTPSHWAIYGNQPEALRILLDAGADMTILNHANMNLIHAACDWNKPEMLEVLASYKDFDPNVPGDHGMTPIHFCAARDSDTAAKKLLELQVKLCIRDDHGVYPVHRAAANGSTKVLEILLSEGEKLGCTRADQFHLRTMRITQYYILP
ncbi:uncharacterized protein [Amphiura filiformis]|uniref:uncharacterized protein n=1 Tax=Amphiura filiformis TaxID=82378 RepID=UPI003B20C345